MNYAVHTVVAGQRNSLVTEDLAGAAARFVEFSLDWLLWRREEKSRSSNLECC